MTGLFIRERSSLTTDQPFAAFLNHFRLAVRALSAFEWPAGAALAMETWPVRSRGFMGGVLQGSWGLGCRARSTACFDLA
jgi:SHS family lactate transporter-like MFS transporter